MDPTRHIPATDDTIVALSSAPGPAVRAIVRLSGPASIPILTSIYRPEGDAFPARGVHAGELQLTGLHSPLPAQVFIALAPRSYTGQDVVEFHLVGSPPLVDCLIHDLLSLEARAARPGEFTLRAFLAGKLDLTQAEGVLGVLQAGNRDELQQALGQLAGGLQGPLRQLREDLLCLLADLEAGLDFAEEDIHFIAPQELLERLGLARAQIAKVLEQLHGRSVHARPFRVVLAGQPNAGKSSLFNALLGKDAALTSSLAGTTRDYLTETVRRDGIDFELIDTAGHRETVDAIELRAQALGSHQKAEADLLLVCSPEADGRESPFSGVSLPRHVYVQTKCDLDTGQTGHLATSALTGAGLDVLWGFLSEHARQARSTETATHAARSIHHLRQTQENLVRAEDSAESQGLELVAVELRGALAEIGELTGAVFTDDLLDRIFSRFCIGK